MNKNNTKDKNYNFDFKQNKFLSLEKKNITTSNEDKHKEWLKKKFHKSAHKFVWAEISVIFFCLVLEIIACLYAPIRSLAGDYNPYDPFLEFYQDSLVAINFIFSIIWVLVSVLNLVIYSLAHSHKKSNTYSFCTHILDGPFKLIINLSLILSGAFLSIVLFASDATTSSQYGSPLFQIIWIILMLFSLLINCIIMILAYHYRKENYIIN